MKTKNYVDILLENGIHFNTISKMGKNQVRLLAERVSKSKSNEKCACGCDKDTCPCGPECKCGCQDRKSKKKETKEAVTIGTKTVNTATIPPNGSVAVGQTIVNNDNGTTMVTSSDKIETPKETTESQELGERFKSKAQQKLFFVKCGNGKTKEQKKWCKLRDEFARDTTKRDYKDLPDYVDDKDEKPKRKSRKKPVSKKRKRKRKSTRKRSTNEVYLEKRISEMIEKHIEPGMTKGELLKLIQEKRNESMMLSNPKKLTMFSDEEGIEMKTPIGRLSSLGEDTETAPAPTKDAKTKPGTKKPGRRNPFKRPGTTPKEKPRAEKGAEKQKSDFMLVIKQVLNIS